VGLVPPRVTAGVIGADAVITAVAAGAVLATVADTTIPEAFERAHLFTGLITPAGSSSRAP
jgi:ZIP family zinc transporter